jgi:membrane-bound metal-dependent hydrolase YbcI (DUF457 family)
VDIVTHGMMGVIVASPIAREHPLAAGAFMLGSVLPDLDAFSRVFGKRAFLAAHQTYSHALPVIAAIGGLAWGALRAGGIDAPYVAVALMLGMVFHSILDVTNTFGITLLAPFTHRRFCTEWIFFIDSVVIAATVPALGWTVWRWASTGEPDRVVPLVYIGAMAAYWAARIVLRRLARRQAPEGTMSLIPSALVPWRFYGCARVGNAVETFAITSGGILTDRKTWSVHDAEFPELEALAEFRQMRRVSPAYHAVAVARGETTTVTCKDLRTRNFGASFGTLEVDLAGGAVIGTRFHV